MTPLSANLGQLVRGQFVRGQLSWTLLQWWQAGGNTVSDLTGKKYEPPNPGQMC